MIVSFLDRQQKEVVKFHSDRPTLKTTVSMFRKFLWQDVLHLVNQGLQSDQLTKL